MAFTMEFGTGFEMGQIPRRAGYVDYAGSDTAISSGQHHTGGYSVRVGSISSPYNWSYKRAAASADIYVSAWVYPDAEGTGYPKIQFEIAGVAIADLRWADQLHWSAYVNGAQVAVGSVATSNKVWQHVQIHFICANAGVFETIIDGVPDITYNGDTQPGASDQVDAITITNNATYTDMFFDDIAIGTGGWPGDIRFDRIVPGGDSTVAWSRSAGSDNYALVDEVPPSSADYVYAKADVSDRYGTPGTWDDTDGLGNVVKTPVAVTVWADARKQSGNSDDKLQLTQGDGVNEVNNGYESLLTSYENRWFIRETAPDGGAWTKADVNALVVGIDADMA